jgi:glutamate carboxypeptidase
MTDRRRKAILSFVDAHAADQLQFVIDLCNENSYTYNKKGADKVAAMILDELKGILPKRTILKQTLTGNHHILRNRSSSNAIYLLGHMDTVFPPDHPFQRCRREGALLIGPGTGDMKGGIAVLVYALKALESVDMLDTLDLVLILSADEEIGSTTSRRIFLEARKRAAACLVAECGGLKGEIVVSRNGKLGARIDCTGRNRHVGMGARGKASAVLELAHRIIALESLNHTLAGGSVNVGKVEGGLGPCTVPGKASCLFDVRWTEPAHGEMLLDEIERMVATPLQNGCESSLTVLNSRPAMPMSEATEGLFKILQTIGSSLGQNIAPEHRGGTSDANFFGAAGIPVLDGLGPVAQKDHTSEEYIDIESLRTRTALLALFLMEYPVRPGAES